MKVMSFNILCYGSEGHEWTTRAPHVVDLIKKEMPCTFGVQEATPAWMEYLKNNLPEYKCVGVGRDDGDNEGEYSAVFYKKHIDLLDSGTFWLSETPDVPGVKGWDAVCNRVCTWAVLECKECDKKFVHINTHLDHKGPVARREGIKLVLKKAEEFKDLPVVVTGDFNLDEGCDLYDILVSELKDTKHVSPKTMDGDTFNNFGGDESSIIDFVFINDNFTSEEYRIVDDKADGMYISDHYPVVAMLETK